MNNLKIELQTEFLSDGSPVYNVIAIQDNQRVDFNCIDYNRACELMDTMIKKCVNVTD